MINLMKAKIMSLVLLKLINFTKKLDVIFINGEPV